MKQSAKPRSAATISRRELLAGAAGTLAISAFSRPVLAMGRLSAGDAEILTLSDGSLTLPLNFVFPDVDKAELDALLSANGMPTDSLRPDCNVTLLRSGERLTIFDAGSGAHFMPTAGKLLDSLAEAGIEPGEVTDVVFTHAHPDHLWGLTDDFDELVFPNAQHRINQQEWDFWSSPDTLAAMPEERKNFVVGAQNRFAAIEDSVTFFKPGDEVVPGVEAVETYGHTPGHVSFMVDGGGDPVLIVGDAISNAVVSFEEPAWRTGVDQDPERGAKTRMSLLDRLAADKARLIGFHFPHPGGGMVERKGAAYRFVPL